MTGKHSEYPYEYSHDLTQGGNQSYVDLRDYPCSVIDHTVQAEEPVTSKNYPILFNNDTFDPNQTEGYSVNSLGERYRQIAVG